MCMYFKFKANDIKGSKLWEKSTYSVKAALKSIDKAESSWACRVYVYT